MCVTGCLKSTSRQITFLGTFVSQEYTSFAEIPNLLGKLILSTVSNDKCLKLLIQVIQQI